MVKCALSMEGAVVTRKKIISFVVENLKNISSMITCCRTMESYTYNIHGINKMYEEVLAP